MKLVYAVVPRLVLAVRSGVGLSLAATRLATVLLLLI